MGTVLTLLEDIPYLLRPYRVLPPLVVVNHILETGSADAGMSGGCRWEAFAITPTEYRALVRQARGRYTVPAVPKWVRTRSDWLVWLMKRLHGVPIGTHRTLSRRYERLERALGQAVASNDHKQVLALHLKVVEAGNAIAEFFRNSLPGGSRP